MKKIILSTLVLIGAFTVVQTVAEASGKGFTLNSIVQRADGVHFGVTASDGQQMVIDASQAKALIEQTCPKIHIDNGVFQ